MNQEARLALNELAKAAIGAGKFGDEVIHQQQSERSNNATRKRSVRAGHGVLHRITKKQ